MSGFEIFGVVSAAIAFIDTARGICEAAKDTAGLSAELKAISPQLALTESILNSVQARGNDLGDNAKHEAVINAINICKERSKALTEIFQKIARTENDGLLEQTFKCFRATRPGKKSKVQKLVKDIMDTLHVLHLHRMFEDEAALKKLEAAREYLSRLGPDEENDKIVVHGDGTNVDSEDIKQQFGDHNTQNNYSSGGGNQSFDQRGLHNGDVFYIINCSLRRNLFPMPFDKSGAHHLLTKRGLFKDDHRALMRRIEVPEPLDGVLASLSRFSMSMSQSKQGEHGIKIAAQLSVVLRFLQEVAKTETGIPVPKSVSRQIHHLRRRMKQTTTVKINTVRQQQGAIQLSKAQSQVFVVQVGQWEIRFLTKTLESRDAGDSLAVRTHSTLHVRSLGASKGPHIAAFFEECTNCEHTALIHPIVFAYNEVDRRAKVLDVVRSDDLGGLMKLLHIGEASLRDCDEEGRALLSYACFYSSRDVCEFLIMNGADVDRFDEDFHCSGKKSPLALCSMSCQAAESNDLIRSLQCTKLLLRGGADPTASIRYRGTDSKTGTDIQIHPFPPLIDALGHESTDLYDLLLSEGAPFIDRRKNEPVGQDLWRIVRTYEALVPTETLLALLSLGWDVASTDERGWNCLVYCVLAAKSPRTGKELESLRFLLTSFDQFFAKDNPTWSVLDPIEVEMPVFSWPADLEVDSYEQSLRLHGSYQQDLWYCALYRSGLYSRYDIPPPRSRPTFTPAYTPQHYRALLYLDSWDMEGDLLALDSVLLNQTPLSDDIKERAPAFEQWDSSHFSMMERRLIFAEPDGRVEEDFSEIESSNGDDLVQQEEVDGQDGIVDTENEWSDDPEEEGGVPVGELRQLFY